MTQQSILHLVVNWEVFTINKQVKARGKLNGEVSGHVRHARLVADILAMMSVDCRL